MTHTCALAQIAPVLGNLPANIRTHEELVARARDGGADLVVFPELSLTGYTVRDMHTELALHPDDAALDGLRELSHEITIIAGGIEEGANFGLYNAAFVFERGTVQTYRKVYPPDYGIFEERRYFLAGDRVRVFDTCLGRIGVLICEDLWHLSLPLLAVLEGAQLLVVLSASPERLAGQGMPTSYALNHQHHAALCRLLSVNMLFVNRTGVEDGVSFWGGSEAVDAFGMPVVVCEGRDEQLVFADLSTDVIRRARTESRHVLDEDPHLLLRELQRILRADAR